MKEFGQILTYVILFYICLGIAIELGKLCKRIFKEVVKPILKRIKNKSHV